MTVLENLYNGNIEPTDSESLKNNMRYKEGLRLVGRLQEELSATLNEEKKNHADIATIIAQANHTLFRQNVYETVFVTAMKF